jgi:hypothetical protein
MSIDFLLAFHLLLIDFGFPIVVYKANFLFGTITDVFPIVLLLPLFDIY